MLERIEQLSAKLKSLNKQIQIITASPESDDSTIAMDSIVKRLKTDYDKQFVVNLNQLADDVNNEYAQTGDESLVKRLSLLKEEYTNFLTNMETIEVPYNQASLDLKKAWSAATE